MKVGFPKSIRLLKRYQFQRMANSPRRHVGFLLTIDCRENQLKETRLGITATRYFGKSHERNRFKRLVREAFRLCHSELISGFDLNIKPRPAAKTAKMGDIQNEVLRFLGK